MSIQMSDLKFYICKVCGKIIALVRDGATPTICCGQIMAELVPNTVEGVEEKHIPVLEESKNCVKVTVGSTEHPMSPEHYIKWIMLVTNKGLYTKKLESTGKPSAIFFLAKDEKPLGALAFCNIHMLWRTL